MNSIKVQVDQIKSYPNMMLYVLTTCALMLTLAIQGTIQGNLQVTHFFYAFLACIAFAVWAIADLKARQSRKNQS
ncbi:hypothetical protein I2F27_03480 [Acinetobacter sp. B5B]|uniref:hypothetical protein n=1 Tax=Acinetobacter baretiae TaxID=2605383 RepID=UPI0018C26A5E|nr:hypothetical protein [Acinetobacter baretiae]MBF7682392.1 hypothetical protein [Acinetobacter baretiae]MBF7685884.1 hypothetical protein [Acinetobacter baretiae]